jgi:hypothetical protein
MISAETQREEEELHQKHVFKGIKEEPIRSNSSRQLMRIGNDVFMLISPPHNREKGSTFTVRLSVPPAAHYQFPMKGTSTFALQRKKSANCFTLCKQKFHIGRGNGCARRKTTIIMWMRYCSREGGGFSF